MALASEEEQADVKVSGSDAELLGVWKDRFDMAARDRSRFEPAWALCQSFLANKQWTEWDLDNRRVIEQDNPDDRERHTVNVLTSYVWQVAGEIMADDYRPDLLFRRDDPESQGFSRQAQRAIIYGWEEEWKGDIHLWKAVLTMLTYGLSGLRVYSKSDYGKPMGEFPIGPDGQPIMDADARNAFVEEQFTAGNEVQWEPMHEGKVCWEKFGPYHTYPPPGIEDEANFPWLVLACPYSIQELERYYDKASELREESIRLTNVGALLDPTTSVSASSEGGDRMKGHVMLKRGYEFPSKKYPQGRSIVWAQNTVLERKTRLPIQIKSESKAGLVFLKYHPVEGRFWPLGVVEPGIGPQRQMNRARSQMIEIKDRAGLGRVFAWEGTITERNKPKGLPFELIEVRQGYEMPKETAGVGPGGWIMAEAEINARDLDRVMGVGEAARGQQIPGVSAYSTYAFLAERDARRLGPVIRHTRLQVSELVKMTLRAVKTTWPTDKQIAIAGDEGQLDVYSFNAAELPDDVYVRVGRGAPLPENQAAEVQKIFDIYDRAIAGGQPLPIDWLWDSLSVGKAQPLPKREMQVQNQAARYENMLLARGATIQPNPWDNDELHIIEHRNAQAAYGLIPTMQEVSEAIEMHIQAHSMNQQMKSQQLMQQMATAGGQQGAGAFGPMLEQLAGAGGNGAGQPQPGMAPQEAPPQQLGPGAPIQ